LRGAVTQGAVTQAGFPKTEAVMSDLIREKCVACRRDSPRVTDEEMRELLARLQGWEVTERDGIPRLEKVFRFKNFADPAALAGRIAEIAEEQGHHPSLLIEWGRLTVSWWTHKIRGLHRNDFIMAAKTDDLAATTVQPS
jgi:4a-hydroxytetrahydrobiopterin dehydratase